MEVGPTCHYFMGGIRVDGSTQMTKVPGLFAAGECAAGLHGANRLGGNSLSDLLVFGKVAGASAVDYCKRTERTPRAPDDAVRTIVRSATEILRRESGANPFLVHEKLQAVMQTKVGIIRTRAEIEEALVELAKLRAEAATVKAQSASQYNAGWHEALDLSSLLMMSEAIARAALTREESRGAHTREDFAGEREEWGKVHVVIGKGGAGEMVVRKEESPAGPPELVKIANATIEDLEAGNV
jgi:succinate dehydrogenase / fumarate reductase flavoprotein subunit